MNAREFLDLQDAYQGVYDEIDEEMKPLPKEKMERQAQGAYRKERRAIDSLDTPEANRQMQRRIAMQDPAGRRNVLDKKNMKEETDIFTQILEHLVAEGYADTNENAIAIMANMSEEWREEILDEAAANQSNKQIEKGVKTTYKAKGTLANHASRGLNRLPSGERESKIKRMQGRLETRRDDLFGERNKREDESRAELKKKYGL